jgi:SPP1 family holin
MKVKKDTIIRTVLLIVALINQALTIAGRPVLPIADEQLAEFLSMTLTGFASLWAWWKNNSFTQAAIQADVYKDALKEGK